MNNKTVYRLQIQTPEGGWFYVKERKEGFTYSIYPTDALDESHLERLIKLYPESKFKVIHERGL